MLQPFSGAVDLGRLDLAISSLEQELRLEPQNVAAVQQLCQILDYYVPDSGITGAYTACQQKLAQETLSEKAIEGLLTGEMLVEKYKQWKQLFVTNGLNPELAVIQLTRGDLHTVSGVSARCGKRLKMFAQTEVISKVCHDCYKVQVLTSSVLELMKVHFIFKLIQLPRNNTRKCMVELRENVSNPYKAYIYCQSEEEVEHCRQSFEDCARAFGLSATTTKIAHGCSEYGLKYPKFSYAPDGSHRSFKRPAEWDRKEAEFFLNHQQSDGVQRAGVHTKFMALLEILMLRTWIRYANFIGDEAAQPFEEKESRPEQTGPFLQLIKQQASLRRSELAELKQTASAPSHLGRL